MRVFIDVSGSAIEEYQENRKGRRLLDWLSKYAEGYVVTFDEQIRSKQLFSIREEIVIPDFGCGTNPNCLGAIHLGQGHELKVLLTDGQHPPITHPCKNLLTIDPSMDIDPKPLALHLSSIDDIFRRLDTLTPEQILQAGLPEKPFSTFP